MKLTYLWFFLLLCTATQAAETLLVRYPPPTSAKDVRYGYTIELLRLALDRSGGNYRLLPADQPMNNDRIVNELRSGNTIDVAWLQTTKEREQRLRPIRFPLYQGLLGWRLLLIRGHDQTRFDKVSTLADLSQFSAGLQQDWPDVGIMRNAGLPVVTTPTYDNLFRMLAAGRFDYLSRSILEIALEHAQHKESGLVIEQHLLLYYPGDLYFFVAPTNKHLATRLNTGLKKAVADGSFAALFSRHWGKIVESAGIKRRQVLLLNNPLFPDAPPQIPLLKPFKT